MRGEGQSTVLRPTPHPQPLSPEYRGEGRIAPTLRTHMITYPCPKCRQLLSVTETAATSPSRCPRCGHVGVPRPASAEATVTLAPPVSVAVGQTSLSAGAQPDRDVCPSVPTAAEQRRGPPPLPTPLTATEPDRSPDATRVLPNATDNSHSGTMKGPPALPTMPLRSSRTPKVPGYELFEELGRGAMGVVWKARSWAEPARRPEDDARWNSCQCSAPDALQDRGRGAGSGAAPEHCADPRSRRGQWPAVLRHGVLPGRDTDPSSARPAAPSPRGGPTTADSGASGGTRAPGGDRSP